MKTVTTLILAVFFMGALDAQYFVQKDQPQPCGIDHRFKKRNQKPTEQIDLTNTSWRRTLLIEESNFSKQVMGKDTILIFDELLMGESWEQDEFKALNEFCSINHYSYEVIAVSFFTKQVAVKLSGI